MHQRALPQRSRAADAPELAGTCTPTARHMHMHMCAHLLKAAGTQGALDRFCAEIIYFWIIVDYSC